MSVRGVCSVPYTFLYCSNYVIAYSLISHITVLFLVCHMLSVLERGSSQCGCFGVVSVQEVGWLLLSEKAVVRSVPLPWCKQPRGYSSAMLVPACTVLTGTEFPPVLCFSAKLFEVGDVEGAA